MKYKHIFYYFLFLSLFSFFTCTQVAEIDLPPAPKILVVNSLFSPDSSWLVQVSVPVGVEGAPPKALPGFDSAVVSLWEEGVLIGTLSSVGRGNYTLPSKPQAGKHYRIEVSATGYPKASAESYVPDSSVEVLAAGIDWQNSVNLVEPFNTFEGYPITLIFREPKGEGNHYMLPFYYYDSLNIPLIGFNRLYPHARQLGVYPQDPIILSKASKNTYFIFNDKAIDGNVYELKLFIPDYRRNSLRSSVWINEPYDTGIIGMSPPNENYLEVYTDLRNVSEDLYKFVEAYDVHIESLGDPFAVYSNAYSNIKGGRGIFAGYNAKRVLLFRGKIGY
jgi:Domain of unknown function (DUF4249)